MKKYSKNINDFGIHLCIRLNTLKLELLNKINCSKSWYQKNYIELPEKGEENLGMSFLEEKAY